jgi:hypothetical protein
MARPLRIEFSGAIYQVTSRGNAREDICLDDTDRAMFLGVLAEMTSRFDWHCHVYCLMGNHYPVLLETPEPESFQGNAPTQRRIHAVLQSPPRSGRTCVSGALQGDRGGA